jgi:sterol desaturase/sphingolipid hydroxylase (fatty acid hydroxylase superfamily)
MGKLFGIVVFLLKLFLTFVFTMSALCKLTPKFHTDAYYMIDAEVRNKQFPLWDAKVFSQFNIVISALVFKTIIAISELIGALLIWWSVFGSLILMSVMAGAVFTHISLEEDFIFPLGLLICAFVLFYERCRSTSSTKKKRY